MSWKEQKAKQKKYREEAERMREKMRSRPESVAKREAMDRLGAQGYEVTDGSRPPGWDGQTVWTVTTSSSSLRFFVSGKDKPPSGVTILDTIENFKYKPYVAQGDDPFAQLGRPGEGGR